MTDRAIALAGLEFVDLSRSDAQAMEAEAFTGFYQHTARSLWAYLARVSGDGPLADDLMQEAYLRFLAAPCPGDGEVDRKRWLYRIATNLLRDHWRRRTSVASFDDIPEERLVSSDASAGFDARAVVGPALLRLRPRDRQLLWLAYAEGYTHPEIAEITGLRPASIRILLFRARRKMAWLLRPAGRRNDALV
ncbi:MAG TPA: sigma-70 family RNA polymerase sigma factor [Acidobacteriaceae bacterium]|jgi:RNA polymerase sigma-70 factor (ECF subfamily)|nr:sigma-70 family RNA polymerase sigma factor [Acidobacteriaceae bacterium]